MRDVEDEKKYINDRLMIVSVPQLGTSLFNCHQLQKNAQTLRNENNNHEPWINKIIENGQELINDGHSNAEQFADKIEVFNRLNEILFTFYLGITISMGWFKRCFRSAL